MSSVTTFSAVTHEKMVVRNAHSDHLRVTVLSLITHGYAIVKMTTSAQKAVWSALDEISRVPEDVQADFCFPDRTDGFLPKGGEHAKYTDNVDLCDRFCYWHHHRALHAGHPFIHTPAYQNIVNSEVELSCLTQSIVTGLWDFFRNEEQVTIRDSSYVQLCMYEPKYQEDDRTFETRRWNLHASRWCTLPSQISSARTPHCWERTLSTLPHSLMKVTALSETPP